MKDIIAQLISSGQTEKALNRLLTESSEAALLLATYTNAKSEYGLSMIGFQAWTQINAQVNRAALALADQIEEQKKNPKPAQTKPGKSVFISYSQKNLDAANKVVAYLREKGINPLIDSELLHPGEEIEAFINKCIKENKYVIFLVSPESLVSGWVGLEIITSTIAKNLLDSMLIPVCLGRDWLQPANVTKLLREIKTNIEIHERDRQERYDLGASAVDIEDVLKRLRNHFQNLPDFCKNLNSVLSLDISDAQFDNNMPKIADKILEQ